MKKYWLFILMLLAVPVLVFAQATTYYPWRYRTHATDCTALVDGKITDICYEQDSKKLYKCNPITGSTCNTTAGWAEVSSAQVINTTDDLPEGATNKYNPFGTTVDVSEIGATGTPGATNYLRGDGSWSTVNGTGGGVGTITAVGNCVSGDCLTGGVTNQTLIFEGATDDAYETTLTVIDPTADRTISLPNGDGTLMLTSTSLSGDVTGTPSATVVGDDSHAHTSSTLPATISYLGSLVNLTSEIEGVLPVANGGTGQSAWLNGQIAIGNTTSGGLNKSTLTAGQGIAITNGVGSITINGTLGTTAAPGIIQPSATDFSVSAGVATIVSGIARKVDFDTSAELATLMTDETGTGAAVFANTPTFVTPVLGAATGTSLAATGLVSAGNVTTTGAVTATGTVTGGNITTAGAVSATGTVSGGNITTSGAITATGNMTAEEFHSTGAGVAVMRMWNAAQTFWNDLTSGNQASNITTYYPATGGTLALRQTSGEYTSAQVTEATNLYYTDVRARAAISAGANLAYNSTTGVMSGNASGGTPGGAASSIQYNNSGSFGGFGTFNSTDNSTVLPGSISAGGTGAGKIVFTGADNKTVTLQTTNQTSNTTYILPAAIGTAGQKLTLNNATTGATNWTDDATGAGGGISSLNGLTNSTQTFATPGTSGTAPAWVSSNGVHTLNIPMAATASVTGGLVNKTEYDLFNGKASTTDAKLNKDYKGFQLDNITANKTYVLLRAPYAITVTATHGVLTGGTYANGYWAECDANGANCAGVDGSTAMNVTATNTNDDGTLSNPSIDSGDYLAFVTGIINGTCNITTGLDYTKN